MQSLHKKIQLVTKQTFYTLRNVELKRIADFGSEFSGCSAICSSGFKSLLSSSSSTSFLSKSFGTKTASPASSARHGIAPTLASYRGLSLGTTQSASFRSSLQTRNMATEGSSSENVSASSDVPQPIKFKRLDKTARHIMQIIDKEAVEEVKTNREIPEIKPGYIIQLKVEVPENKRRVSIIKGIVIARRNAGLNTTIRIRRLVGGVGIENLFPLYSPNLKEIKVLDKKKVRRAKLYYLRDRMNPLKK